MSSKFHERMASSAAYQMGSVVAWAERRAIQAIKAGAFATGSVAFFNMLIVWTIVGYLLLYYILIPRPMSFESSLNFDFDSDRDGPFGLSTAQKTSFEFPVARVFFPSFDQQWIMEVPEKLNNDTTRKVYPGAHDNPVLFAEVYDVTLFLTLPEVSINQDVGNFMTETELLLFSTPFDLQPKVLVRSRRPLAVPYRTWLSRGFSDIVLLPFRWMFGWFQPENTLTVPVVEGWLEETDHRRLPNGVRVTVSDPRLIIHRGSIRFDVRLSGLRYYMYYWFWTTFALLVSFAITFQSGITLSALIAHLVGPAVRKRVRFQLPALDIFGGQVDEDEARDRDDPEDNEDSDEESEEGTTEEELAEPIVGEDVVRESIQVVVPPAPSADLAADDDERGKDIAELFPSMARRTSQLASHEKGSEQQVGAKDEPESDIATSEFVTPVQSESEAEEEGGFSEPGVTTAPNTPSQPEAAFGRVDNETIVEYEVPLEAAEVAETALMQEESNSAQSPLQERTARLSSDLDVVLVETPSSESPPQANA